MLSIVMIGSGFRQGDAEYTIPRWLDQAGIDLEVILVTDAINYPAHPRLRILDPGIPFDFIRWYNLGFKAARGEVILITQCDIEVNNKHLLFNMLRHLRPGYMVSERFFKKGKRSEGLWCQLLMLYAEDLQRAGYYHEGYCGLCSFEDSDLMATLLENGLYLDLYSQDEDYASFHIDHPTNYTDPTILKLIDKAQDVYNSRHKHPYLTVWAQSLINERRARRTK
jgi:hypothetical protein